MATKKPFAFKSSKLSTAADQLWTASKSGFKAGEVSVKLDLGKTLTEKAANNVNNSSSTLSKGYIFGSKLAERVIVDHKSSEKGDGSGENEEEQTRSTDSPKTVSDVFESIQKKGNASSFLASDRSQYEEESASTSWKLKESAEAQSLRQETPILPKPAENIEISTGEEGETNVYHAMCKLHSFDLATKMWVERGMGSLRINRRDDSPTSLDYRIVGRITGNQRVVLNSKIFADFILEKVSPKRIKFSATTPDSELPVLFLASASEFVTEQLYSTLQKIAEKKKEEATKRKRKASGCASDEDDSVQSKKSVVSEK